MAERNFLYALGDNFIGYDDGVTTPGERFGRGVNALATALYQDPRGVVVNALTGVQNDLNNLMFEGGAMQRPGAVLGYAAAPIAPGAAAGIPAGAIGANGIRAYHGSPHSFDKFSMDKIGTGEGAQAYGHGLYFAENEAVARGYRDALAPANANVDMALRDAGGDFEAAIAEARRRVAHYEGMPEGGKRDALLRINRTKLSELEAQKAGAAPQRGSMYEVRINADPDDFLDWDQPMSKQPEKVRSALGNVAEASDWEDARDKWGGRIMQRRTSDGQVATIKDEGGYYTVRVTPPDGNYYDASKRSLEDAKAFADKYQAADARNAASFFKGKEAELRAAGVPGVKYFDEQSRTGRNGEGTRNFVVFDENLIEIVRKYGVAGAAAMLGATAADVQAAMSGGQQQ